MMPGLRDILDAATPGPWHIDARFPRGIYGKAHAVATAEKVGKGVADAALIALAPELAAGNLETIDFLRWLISDPEHAALLNHDEACTDDAPETCEACALLARLDRIGKED